jgi:hypothetical protein
MTPEERLTASRDPERWDHAPLRPRDNPFGQLHSPKNRTVLRSVIAVAVVAAIGGVLVVGAVIGRGAGTVSPPAGPAPTSSPTQIPDPTPAPTVAPTEEPIVNPASEATCTNLLDSKRVTKFENAGWSAAGPDWVQKVIDEGDGKGLSRFADGIICRWGVMNGDQSVLFGYAAISDADAEIEKARILDNGGDMADDSYEHYLTSGSEYAFGDGFWLYFLDNAGEPNLMNMLYRNAAKL